MPDIIEFLLVIWELNYSLIGVNSNNGHSGTDCNFAQAVYVVGGDVISERGLFPSYDGVGLIHD